MDGCEPSQLSNCDVPSRITVAGEKSQHPATHMMFLYLLLGHDIPAYTIREV